MHSHIAYARALGGYAISFAELGAAGSDDVQLAAFGSLGAISHIHTAANSPAMCDAAAVLLVGDEVYARSTFSSLKWRLLIR